MNAECQNEIWKQVEFGYEVSSLGRARNSDGRVLRLHDNSHGYLSVRFYNSGTEVRYYIHRLVCALFNGPAPSDDHQVDHINRQRGDNRSENLRWVKKSENLRHRRCARGVGHGRSKLTETEVRKIKGRESYHLTDSQAAELFGVRRGTISKIRSGKRWGHIHA